MNAADFKKLVYNVGEEPRPYSGRCMYGKECWGIDLAGAADVWRIAMEMARAEPDAVIPAPVIDSMGLGIIAYWPGFEVSEEEHNAFYAEEEEEDRRHNFRAMQEVRY